MSRSRNSNRNTRTRPASRRVSARNILASHRSRVTSPRTNVGHCNVQNPFAPPEDWYELDLESDSYRVIEQEAGEGYCHILTAAQIVARLAQLPEEFLSELAVVQLSSMTRKKESFPCYGMQWGASLYLYPIEASLTEYFYSPPPSAMVIETKMYGGKWSQEEPNEWKLTWTEETIQDFYLNNILIHELGHLLDTRNSSYRARESYAEWFAIEYGYKATGGAEARGGKRKIIRRHHA